MTAVSLFSGVGGFDGGGKASPMTPDTLDRLLDYADAMESLLRRLFEEYTPPTGTRCADGYRKVRDEWEREHGEKAE